MSEPPDQTVAPFTSPAVLRSLRAEVIEAKSIGLNRMTASTDAIAELFRLLDAAEARAAAAEDTTWFWAIADKDGLTGLPSDERAALRILVDRAARALPAPRRMRTVEEVEGLAEAPILFRWPRRGARWFVAEPERWGARRGWRTGFSSTWRENDLVGAAVISPLPDIAIPIEEAPFVGDPRGDDWPGYHTHWTPMLDCPVDPRALLQGQEPAAAGTVGDGR